MTLKNQNRLSIYILISLVVFCIIFEVYTSNDMKNNGVILNGRILSSSFPARSSVMNFKYEFYFNNIKFEDYSAAGVTNDYEFIGKTFPIKYSLKSGRSELLITPGDFEKYGIQYPDSLNWVKKYVISFW